MITYDQVTDTSAYGAHLEFVTFASDLGLKPGDFPRFLQTSIGNKQHFEAKTKKITDGDLEHVRYTQIFGMIDLIVLND
jgi:3-hydroxyisobutyrate dehydrogenase-like beta-hydroxyacid dehydrogenase